MAHRRIGHERLGFAASRAAGSSLDELAGLIEWQPLAALLKPIHASAKGEAAWPPLAMFRALLLSVWYDLSDVKLAEALGDRASFRRFCGFSGSEPVPERTAFVRFRQALVAAGLDRALFEAVTRQLKAKAVRVKTGTIVDATIIASAGADDDDARWVKHQGRPAVHGFKAHVGADADTALVEEVAVTPANINDGRAGPAALPEKPGEVFADSAYRGAHFREAVRAKGGTPHIAVTGMWGSDEQQTLARLAAFNASIHACAAASRKSSALGSEVTGSGACDGSASPKPPPRFTSPPSPITSSEPTPSPSRPSDQTHGALGTVAQLTSEARSAWPMHLK